MAAPNFSVNALSSVFWFNTSRASGLIHKTHCHVFDAIQLIFSPLPVGHKWWKPPKQMMDFDSNEPAGAPATISLLVTKSTILFQTFPFMCYLLVPELFCAFFSYLSNSVC